MKLFLAFNTSTQNKNYVSSSSSCHIYYFIEQDVKKIKKNYTEPKILSIKVQNRGKKRRCHLKMKEEIGQRGHQ